MSRRFMPNSPLWARVLVIAFLVWLLWIVVIWVLGADGGESVQRGEAATTCPNYVLAANPVTGGTYMMDACTQGEPKDAATISSSVTAAAASASYGSCRSAWIKKTWENKAGWTLYWVRLEKYWCWRGSKITYKPATSFTHGVTGFGSAMQWHDRGEQEKQSWNSPDGWQSHSWGIDRFEQCFPYAFGCQTFRTRDKRADVYAYGNGSYQSN